MKKITAIPIYFIFITLLVGCSNHATPSLPTNIPLTAVTEQFQRTYLDQTLPGITPEVFAPGIVSTANSEGSLVVTLDGKEIYFWAFFPAEEITRIYYVKFVDQQWSEPQTLPFSGQYIDAYVALHPDGSRLYFQSNRPIDRTISNYKWNIWYVDRIEDTWGERKPIDQAVNGRNNVSGPSVTRDGTMYFTLITGRRNDIYRSEYVNGKYQIPEKLPDTVNGAEQQFDSYIAPDESYLLFDSYQRSDSCGGTDLYVSFRDEDGNWSEARNLGPTINTNDDEGPATISPDSKYIFYSRYNGNNNPDIFWFDAQFLNDLR